MATSGIPEGGEPASNGASPKATRARPTRVLPTDRIAFPKQLDLLRIYAVASGPTRKTVTLAEVENIIKMKSSTISLANPFFTDIGLIQKVDKGFVPADALLNYQRAHAWNPDVAAHKLQPVIEATWFAQALLPILHYRPMSETEAIGALADACNASPDYEPQLHLLLDYLSAAGFISSEGGQVRAIIQQATERSTPAPAQPDVPTEVPAASMPSKAAIATAFSQPTEGTVQFHVSVRVDMNEFAGWKADRIAAFFGGIAQVLAAKGALERDSAGK